MDALLSRFAELGVQIDTLLWLPAVVVPMVELAKKHLKISGRGLLVASFASSFLWSVIFYAPAIPAVLVSTFMGGLLSSGGFQVVKTMLGKVGEDKK